MQPYLTLDKNLMENFSPKNVSFNDNNIANCCFIGLCILALLLMASYLSI